MKKIIVSAAVAALALTTTASALEDIKVNGQAKVWYETNDKKNAGDKGLFSKDTSGAEAVFKLGMTGKQGNVGFGTTVYQGSTMGLEGVIVEGARTGAVNGDMFVGEAYVTAPVMGATLKLGKQELNTPFAFTEKWNAIPNTFNAGVLVVPAATDLTVVAAFVGQVNTNAQTAADGWKATPDFYGMHGGAYALGALYNNKTVAANLWAYHLNDLNLAAAGNTLGNSATLGDVTTGASAMAVWLDASVKVGPANVKAIVAMVSPDAGPTYDDTTAFALSGGAKVAGWSISAAASQVSEPATGKTSLPVANVGTGFKKTKLPTAGVYTDGQYVAQQGSTAIKVKAAGKVGSTGLAIQAVNNTNDMTSMKNKETTEIDLIVSQKLGDFNVKGIVINRSFADSTTDTASGAMHVRAIVSLNF